MTTSSHLFDLPENVETKWASPENPDATKGTAAQLNNGRKGRPCFTLKAGEQTVLAHAENSSGIIRRSWMTINDRSSLMLRGLRIDIYWDGAATPAVSAPLGDFFGQGLGRMQTFESIFFSNPEGRSFNCVVPMPFRKGFRILLTNETNKDLGAIYYDVNYTLGDEILKPVYFHAHWRREIKTTLKKDFQILPKVTGHGRYLGANFSVIENSKEYPSSWFGEGECKFYLDGDTDFPSLAGTGVEDYIGTAWGQGQYAHLYQGCHLADRERCEFAFYRYHAPDPIYFKNDISVTFQQIGFADWKVINQIGAMGKSLISIKNGGELVDMRPEPGKNALFEREDDWASCCYFYLDRPENDLPALASIEERVQGLVGSTEGPTVGVANPL